MQVLPAYNFSFYIFPFRHFTRYRSGFIVFAAFISTASAELYHNGFKQFQPGKGKRQLTAVVNMKVQTHTSIQLLYTGQRPIDFQPNRYII